MTGNPQRVKVGVAALMDRIETKIKEREAELLAQSMAYATQRQKWFDAADAALNDALTKVQEGQEPEEIRYGKRGYNIHIDIDEEFPEDPDADNDSTLRTMRRHHTLLAMAVDSTIAIDPTGEYGKYL